MDHNYNSSCKFAEDVLAYLYGEIETSEKLRFEKHLAGCNSCADELAGFSFVRSSVMEWRTEEFSSLSTPIIKIPYEKTSQINLSSNVKENSRSWLSQIGELFSFSNKWVPLTAGIAIFSVCAGLLFFVLSSRIDTSDVARVNSNKNSEVNSASNLKTELADKSEISKTQTSESSEDTIVKSTVTERSVTPTKISSTSNGAKINSGKSNKAVLNTPVKPPVKTQAKSSNKSRRPSLTGDDDEDDSLRLSDLLEEISMNIKLK